MKKKIYFTKDTNEIAIISYIDEKGNTVYSNYLLQEEQQWVIYNKFNKPLKVISDNGYLCTYEYNEMGDIIAEKDNNGYTRVWIYDELNRCIKTITTISPIDDIKIIGKDIMHYVNGRLNTIINIDDHNEIIENIKKCKIHTYEYKDDNVIIYINDEYYDTMKIDEFNNNYKPTLNILENKYLCVIEDYYGEVPSIPNYNKED